MSQTNSFDDFKGELSRREDEIAKLLPPTVTPDFFLTCAIMAVKQSTDLLRCDRRSLHTALTKSAMDGLVPDGRLAVILPFKDKDGVQRAGYIPMYQGIVQRAWELGDVGPINASIVREHDRFLHAEGDAAGIVHERPPLGHDRGEIVGAYAIFWVRGQIWHREVFDIADIEKARSVSRAANGPAWRNWYEEMARIRPIRRGSKYVPMKEQLRRIIEREDELVDLDATPLAAPVVLPEAARAPTATIAGPGAVVHAVPAVSNGRGCAEGVGIRSAQQRVRAIDIGFTGIKRVG